MDKEDVLQKSRQEHKDRDLYSDELNTKAATVGSVTATVVATLLFVAQQLLGGGWNFALYAVVFAVGAATFISKALAGRRRRYLLLSIAYCTATLIFCGIHLYTLAVV